jgi:2-amino-4-hydroxy-6-hydroxymethyldihydropteridine diphosphokinase
MNTAIVLLGSNVDADQNIDAAKDRLSEFFEIDLCSSRIESEAIGENYVTPFLNEAVKLYSDETSEETIAIFKQIEAEMGRTPESKKKGIVPIDIDLIFWNDNLMRNDYHRFPFVKKCVDEIR